MKVKWQYRRGGYSPLQHHPARPLGVSRRAKLVKGSKSPFRNLLLNVARRGRVSMDESEDTGENDKDRRQGSTWGGLFAAAGQGGRSGGMSPTRSSEVKKAIRAAMAFGLPKGGGASGGGGKESGRNSPTYGKGDEPEMDGSSSTYRTEAGKGNIGYVDTLCAGILCFVCFSEMLCVLAV